MSSDDGREYVQALSRLIETCASTYPGSAARDAAARDVENRSRRRPLALELDGDLLRIGGDDAVPFDAPGTEALVSAFLAHAIGRMSIRQLTPARDFLEMARLLSVRPSDPQGGHAIEREVSDARLWNVEFIGLASLDSKPVTALLPAEMLLSLRDGADYAHAEAALAKLATRGEEALAEGDARVVAAVLVAMSTFEQESHHDNLRHTAELAMKRLISPMALRLTAQLIPSARRRESLIAVLSQAGEDGAEALFAHLVASQDMHERRAYFDAMVALGSGISMLMQALDDEQWYVARNAAETVDAALLRLREIVRLDLGTVTLREERVRLQDVVHAILPPFTTAASDQEVTVQADLPPTLPAFVADRGRLQEALSVILHEILRQSPSGATLSLEGEDDRRELRLVIRGGGVPEHGEPLAYAERLIRAHAGSVETLAGRTVVHLPRSTREDVPLSISRSP